jgi:molybdopterin converting factor small subunit
MPTIRIPTPLRTYTNGQTEVKVQGSTVQAAMEDLVTQFPALRPHLFNGRAELRPFVNLFLNDQNIRDLRGLETPLNDDDRLLLIPSIAGGNRQAEDERQPDRLVV